MAFADPQSVTIGGSAVSMPRVSSGVNQGVFQSNDGKSKLSITHTIGKQRDRHVLRLDDVKVAADPFQTSVNARYSMSIQVIADVPKVGYTVAEQKAQADAVVAYLTASSGARLTQLLGSEN